MAEAAAHSDGLTALIAFFETVSPSALDDIDRIYAQNARFRDPFNDVQGIAAIRAIFVDMFEQLDEPRFTVTEAIEHISTPTGGGGTVHTAFLTWDFEFRIRRLQPARSHHIEGATRVVFGQDGRVLVHRDYWDAAGELYARLPVIGALMRWLQRRIGTR